MINTNSLASACFFTGSTLFLPWFGDFAIVGIWLFMLGSAMMFWQSIKNT
ncbi:YrhK family protein [Planctobacterium marinum]